MNLESFWNPIDDRQHIGAEAFLQLGVFVEVVQDHLGHGVTFEHNDQALTGATRGFVSNIGNAGDFSLFDQLGNLHCQVVGVYLIRQLRDNQGSAAILFLHGDHRTHRDRPATGAVGVVNAPGAENLCPGGEVGSFDAFHAGLEKFLVACLWMREVPGGSVRDLPQVMGRNIGRHSDGNTD